MRTLPSVIRARIESALQTQANNADPRMEVFLGRTSDVITATERFLVRTARSGEELGAAALAVERPNPTQPPTKLWMIYVKSGTAYVASAPLPFAGGPNWVEHYALGPAVDVAIEFDGLWDEVRNSLYVYTRPPKSRFVHYTQGEPWLFCVTEAGALVAQQGKKGVVSSLAENRVTAVAAKRGWRSVVTDDDQGLIAAYIRDGQVHYRSYELQASGQQGWSLEENVQSLPTPADSVSLFRTNDYRTGFLASALGQIYWAITARTWSGMAIEAHMAVLDNVSATVGFHKVRYHDFACEAHRAAVGISAYVAVNYAAETYYGTAFNEDAFTIHVDLPGSLFGCTLANVTIRDSANITWPIGRVTRNGWRLTLDCADFNNAVGDMTIFFGSGITGGVGQTVAPFNVTFTPTGLIPVILDPPEVVRIINVEVAPL